MAKNCINILKSGGKEIKIPQYGCPCLVCGHTAGVCGICKHEHDEMIMVGSNIGTAVDAAKATTASLDKMLDEAEVSEEALAKMVEKDILAKVAIKREAIASSKLDGETQTLEKEPVLKAIQCHKCPEKFFTWSDFVRHRWTHIHAKRKGGKGQNQKVEEKATPNMIKCHKCPRTFPNNSEYSRHRWTHIKAEKGPKNEMEAGSPQISIPSYTSTKTFPGFKKGAKSNEPLFKLVDKLPESAVDKFADAPAIVPQLDKLKKGQIAEIAESETAKFKNITSAYITYKGIIKRFKVAGKLCVRNKRLYFTRD